MARSLQQKGSLLAGVSAVCAMQPQGMERSAQSEGRQSFLACFYSVYREGTEAQQEAEASARGPAASPSRNEGSGREGPFFFKGGEHAWEGG